MLNAYPSAADPWNVNLPTMPPRPNADRKPKSDKKKREKPERVRPAASAPPAPLDAYRRKRDPERTTEPFGGSPAARAPGAPATAPAATPTSGARFVVQQHWARNMHLSLIHISEPTRLLSISYAVF